jgi:hypothetical protein
VLLMPGVLENTKPRTSEPFDSMPLSEHDPSLSANAGVSVRDGLYNRAKAVKL